MMRRNPPQFLDTPAPLPPNLSYVLDIPPSVMTLGLVNIRALTEALGHPERRFKSVVVAGTNGKGSVTAFLSSLLTANGRRTGWFCSPHVYSVNERISVDNAPVTIKEMEAAAARIVPMHDRIPFSYFEAMAAMAFVIFAERQVDIAVLETGLGGRFDATNVVEPVLSIITSIALDHRRLLGDTLDEILREKMGIVRPGVTLMMGRLDRRLQDIAREKGARDGFDVVTLDELGQSAVVAQSVDGATMSLCTPQHDYGTVPLPFAGRHQADNALLAVAAAEQLLGEISGVSEAAAAVTLPGRFEMHHIADKTVVLDVAHNDDALNATAETLAALSPRDDNAIVIGMLPRKELETFPQRVAQYARRVHLIDPVPGESATSAQVAARFGVSAFRGRSLDVFIETAFEEDDAAERFMGRMLSLDYPARAILITGSFRTVEVIGNVLKRRFL